jgi:hypothetical protein
MSRDLGWNSYRLLYMLSAYRGVLYRHFKVRDFCHALASSHILFELFPLASE